MNKFLKIVVSIGLFTKLTSSCCIAQNNTSIEITDDPIVSALDSLYKLDLFEMGYQKINYPSNSKYNFPIDSIPRYDAATYASRLGKLNALSPFDLRYNEVVKSYIDMYAMRKRANVARMMALSQYYFPLYEEALDKYNLPLELKYLSICESALNPVARSRAGAAGLWQFMYPTGKMFGLKVNSYVDERYDPHKSTIAACEYFKYLYSLYNDWELVLAAYNCGPGNVNKAIRKSGGKRTYWEVRPFLPKETQGYVPAFIAVNYVMNYTAEHNIHSATPKQYFSQVDTVHIKKQLSFHQIASILNIPEEEIQILNPSYRKRVIPVTSGFISVLTLPSDKMGLFISNEDKIYNNFIEETAQTVIPETELLSIAPKNIVKIHTVRRGENIAMIAKKYGCTATNIKTWNKLKSNVVQTGKKLKIYPKEYIPIAPTKKEVSQQTETTEVPASSTVTPVSENKEVTTNTEVSVIPGEFVYHKIKQGDTLYKLAKKYNTTIDNIKRLNNMGINYQLLPGKKIKVGVL